MDNEVIEGLKLSTWLNGTPRESILEMYERDKDKPLSEFSKTMMEYRKKFGPNDLGNEESSYSEKTWIRIMKFCMFIGRSYTELPTLIKSKKKNKISNKAIIIIAVVASLTAGRIYKIRRNHNSKGSPSKQTIASEKYRKKRL